MRETNLLIQAVLKGTAGFLLVCLFLFLPAGTLAYPGAWLFLALLFVPMGALCAVLYRKAPELLRKRLNTREKQAQQKAVVGLGALVFVISFVLAGLDRRFGWSNVPLWAQILAGVVQLAAYALYAEVMRENAYLSRTVEVQKGQKLIDTGLYSVVRHPMYAAASLLFLAIPVVLGSWPAFAVMLVYPILLAARIKNEEQVLAEGLDGYAEYMRKVKWRMLPFLW